MSNLNRNWSSNFLYIVFLFYTIFLSKCSSFMACLSFCAYIHFQCTIAHSIHVFDKRSEAITALCCYPTFFSKIHSRELLFFLMFPFVQIYYGKRPFCNYDWLQIVDSSQVVVLARGNQSFALQKSLQRLLRKHCILSLRTSTLIDKKKVVQTLKRGDSVSVQLKWGAYSRTFDTLRFCGNCERKSMMS